MPKKIDRDVIVTEDVEDRLPCTGGLAISESRKTALCTIVWMGYEVKRTKIYGPCSTSEASAVCAAMQRLLETVGPGDVQHAKWMVEVRRQARKPRGRQRKSP